MLGTPSSSGTVGAPRQAFRPGSARMSARTLVRLGLVLVVGALVIPVLRMSAHDQANVWSRWLLRGAGGVFVLALLIYVLEKIGMKAAGARCIDCRKRIPYGHSFCFDHLRDRTFRAREASRGARN